MAFYDNFIKSTVTPKQFWDEGIQELVNDQFTNASSIQFDVEEEDEFGSMTFHPVECRITSLVDAKTGQRNNDDYKKIIFRDLKKEPEYGTRYRFSDNIWMVFSTDNLKTPTSSAYLRRCNNVITIEDKYGNIRHEPCYIDYRITETQLFKEYTMDVPMGRIWVTAQLNKYTKDIDINDRFIFNGGVYKIRELNKFDRSRTMDKNTAYTISFYADVDAKNPADRFDIDVADYFDPPYSVEVLSNIRNGVGSKGTVECKVTFTDNSIVDEPIYYESTNKDVCIVNQYNGNYELVGVGECQIYCKLFNNMNIFDVVDVESLSENPNEIIDKIDPDIKYIKLNQTINYSIYSYKNGVRLSTKFDIQAYDIPDNYFSITTDGNNFSISYFRYCENGILKVVCTNLDTGNKTTLLIALGGVW